jgi:hypothetical protein
MSGEHRAVPCPSASRHPPGSPAAGCGRASLLADHDMTLITLDRLQHMYTPSSAAPATATMPAPRHPPPPRPAAWREPGRGWGWGRRRRAAQRREGQASRSTRTYLPPGPAGKAREPATIAPRRPRGGLVGRNPANGLKPHRLMGDGFAFMSTHDSTDASTARLKIIDMMALAQLWTDRAARGCAYSRGPGRATQ